jgi:glutathione synthase/RimK-type ligase-like ATP-grasp enzyme
MGSISVNSSTSVRISRDKHLTSQLLRRVTPYVTEAEVFAIENATEDLFNQLKAKHHKLVVKPIDENNGIGITTDISNRSAYRKSCRSC